MIKVRTSLPKTLIISVIAAFIPMKPLYAQISADLFSGGAIKIGPSTTTCDSNAKGAIRYNTTDDIMEFCNGAAWTAFVQQQSSPGITAPAGSGYFVMTHTTWNGNLGGLAGADAKCLTELGTTYTSWKGYTTANGNGQITAGKVKAFLCDYSCNNLMPLTTYYFAYANNGSIGGASFTTDATGRGPSDSNPWSAANYFGGTYTYWTGRTDDIGSGVDPQAWFNTYSGYVCDNGSAWTATTSGYIANTGNSSTTDAQRWWSNNYGCNTSRRLICFVNP